MKILASGLYLLFVILVLIFLPNITIPMFQDLGLMNRDIVGFSVLIDFIALLLMLVFGSILWWEFDK